MNAASWPSNDNAGAYASPLKWPIAGWRTVSNQGVPIIIRTGVFTGSRIWSTTILPGDRPLATLNIRDTEYTLETKIFDDRNGSFFTSRGNSVRCIQN